MAHTDPEQECQWCGVRSQRRYMRLWNNKWECCAISACISRARKHEEERKLRKTLDAGIAIMANVHRTTKNEDGSVTLEFEDGKVTTYTKEQWANQQSALTRFFEIMEQRAKNRTQPEEE